MTAAAWDWFWLIAGCALTGAVVIALNWHPAPRDQAAWDRSAARDFAADIATARRQREIAELNALYKAPSRARTIPHQTRRTEEDQ